MVAPEGSRDKADGGGAEGGGDAGVEPEPGAEAAATRREEEHPIQNMSKRGAAKSARERSAAPVRESGAGKE
jgi:hypothetical protein